MSSRRPAVLAVDSGATKIDAALIGADGRVIAAVRGRGTSFSPEDHDQSVEALLRVLGAVAGTDGDAPSGPLADVAVFCIAGADLPVDDRRLTKAIYWRSSTLEPTGWRWRPTTTLAHARLRCWSVASQ